MKEPKKNYNLMKDAELRDILFRRGLTIPMDDDGKLLRAHAVAVIEGDDEQRRPLADYPKVRVIFHRTAEASNNKGYIFVKHNDLPLQIPYGVEVKLPEPVLKSTIDNAVIKHYEFDGVDEQTNTARYTMFESKRFPYTFLGYVEEEAA